MIYPKYCLSKSSILSSSCTFSSYFANKPLVKLQVERHECNIAYYRKQQMNTYILFAFNPGTGELNINLILTFMRIQEGAIETFYYYLWL